MFILNKTTKVNTMITMKSMNIVDTKNLKPFDLDVALNGEPVMLRNGRKAYIRHHETSAKFEGTYKLWGFVEGGEKNMDFYRWTSGGKYVASNVEDNKDIIGMWPKTHVINGFEVPAPETTAPSVDTIYYIPIPHASEYHVAGIWYNEKDKIEYQLKRGLVFLNKEDAIANAKAMLGMNPIKIVVYTKPDLEIGFKS